MKVLVDNGVPNTLADTLRGHHVTLARKLGWAELVNGELIAQAEQAGFDLLLSTDKNIRYQQNLSQRKIAIVILGRGNLPLLLPHLKAIAAAVDASTPGSYTEIAIPLLTNSKE